MRFSLPLGRIAGIDIRLHLTFFLLFLWVASVVLGQGGSAATVVAESAFVVLVFGCVLLHELGHALAARYYGIKTRDIVLLPIGGVARLEDIPEKPSQELVVVAAGPAVNAVLAVLALALLPVFGGSLTVSLFEGALLPRLALVNIAMVVFNLIPAFPMDGGRILRALLAFQLERTKATRIAGRVGQGFAVAFALFGFFANPLLILIALFIWFGAAQEIRVVEQKAALRSIFVKDVMVRSFHSLWANDSLAAALELSMSTGQRDFPVVGYDGNVVGLLTEQRLIQSVQQHGPSATVGAAMQDDFPFAQAGESVELALSRMSKRAVRTIPVLDGGRLLGLLRLEDLGRQLAIRGALG